MVRARTQNTKSAMHSALHGLLHKLIYFGSLKNLIE